jgi:5'-3' exonuclease
LALNVVTFVGAATALFAATIAITQTDIKKIIEGLNIPILETDGFEADDVIGTLAKQAEKAGYQVYMVTPDKDYGQLVSDNIKIFKPPYQGGDFEIIGPKEVCEKWNIKDVSQVIDILAMMGDAVDNIPGIPGVGEKTAAKLLAEYGTVEKFQRAYVCVITETAKNRCCGTCAGIASRNHYAGTTALQLTIFDKVTH